MISFSVIIPTYNRKKYLLECLETVFAQSYAPHEVIVVDDGSTDGTVEALQKFEDRLKVIRQPNAGPGAARNRGALVAGGDYLAFLDSDDRWFPWALASFAELIVRHGNPALVFGRFVDFRDVCELTDIGCENPAGASYSDFLSSHAEGHFCGAGMMVVERTAFQQIGGFEEDRLNAEDHDLALKLGTKRGFVQIRQPVTVGHRLVVGSEMTDLGKSLRGLARLVSKEKAGRYPGGSVRKAARRKIIAGHVRPAVIGAMKSERNPDAWALYWDTFGWNLRFGRGAYLAAAPLLAAKRRMKPN